MRYFFSLLFFYCTVCSVFAQRSPVEKLYLQTDRETYVTGEPILFKINAIDGATHRASSMSKIGYIVLRNAHSAAIRQLRIRIDNGVANGNISLPDTLSSGLYQVVAFTNLMRNYDEKFYAAKQVVVVNQSDTNFDFYKIKGKPAEEETMNSDGQFKISCDSAWYGFRQRVKISLHAMPHGTNVAVSVYENSGQAICSQTEFANNAGYQPVSNYEYLPETRGNILRGTVIDAFSQQKIKNAIVLLSRIDTIPNLKYAVTDSEGKFRIFLSNYYDGQDLFLTIKNIPKDAAWRIKVEDKFALNQMFTPSPVVSIDTAFFAKSQNIVYVNNAYEVNPYQKEKAREEIEAPPSRFHYESVTTIYPSDYISLDNFSEIVTELLPFTYIKKDGDRKWIEIVGASSSQFEKTGAALFLDGVYVDDVNKVLGFGSDLIKKIELLTKERCFGDLVFQGMVSISGKENLIRTVKLPAYSLRVANPEISNNRFLSANADPAEANKNKPFVRQLLYWNPNISVSDNKDTDIVFFTSENKGFYTVRAEGVTPSGQPICATAKFEVK